ncbi:hypothetical protein KL918_004813 [Ogataea parapolymorpha]|nr:hypothetical protein KL918_004813 [Ogataea parapolymorpha]KAG7872816.1 hypothetical protein KL916_002861 [Ogataea parapolymorpha]
MRAQDNGASHLLSEAEAEIALCRGSDDFVEESADGDNIKRTEALNLVLDVDDRAVIQLEQLLGVRVSGPLASLCAAKRLRRTFAQASKSSRRGSPDSHGGTPGSPGVPGQTAVRILSQSPRSVRLLVCLATKTVMSQGPTVKIAL